MQSRERNFALVRKAMLSGMDLSQVVSRSVKLDRGSDRTQIIREINAAGKRDRRRITRAVNADKTW